MSLRFAAVTLVAFLAGCQCGAPRTELPTYRAERMTGVTVDGDLSEWNSIAETETFVSTMDGSPGYARMTARLGWDDEALYVAASIPDTHLVSTNTDRDDHLWEEDCLELMIDRDGEGLGEGYVELQISPRNVVFDTWFAGYRAPPPFGHIDWDSGMTTAVVTHGTLDDTERDSARPDEGYDVEARIPWTALATTPNAAFAVPHAGDTIRVAIYVLDALEGGGQGALAWSAPMVGDFHVADRMGRVVLQE